MCQHPIYEAAGKSVSTSWGALTFRSNLYTLIKMHPKAIPNTQKQNGLPLHVFLKEFCSRMMCLCGKKGD